MNGAILCAIVPVFCIYDPLVMRVSSIRGAKTTPAALPIEFVEGDIPHHCAGALSAGEVMS